jgi:hypothetical protein
MFEHLGNQLPVIAKWELMLKLYELDKPTVSSAVQCNSHLNLTGDSIMKASLAAQVMSHTVAASLNALVDTTAL